MRKSYTLLSSLLVAFTCFSQPSTLIRLNQVGFYTQGPKKAVVVTTTATTFTVKSEARDSTFYTGTLSAASEWAQSGEKVKVADFTGLVKRGRFVLEVPSIGYSYVFSIQDQVLVPTNKALTKAYYFNRNSMALEEKYAGQWSRAAGHPDDKVIVHPSAASTLRPTGTLLSCPKGWYDAGDYNSYIVNSGITTYSLLISYEHFQKYYDTLNLNIPESENALPDILDEIKWNLDWMLTMLDPNDGGVYTKKTNAGFDGFVMPDEAIEDRYVVKKSTAAAFDFAAVMAVASRVYQAADPVYAATCLAAAKKAYAWGIANPKITFGNPGAEDGYPAITTGGYGDGDLTDEMEWASNELYITTKDEALYANGFKNTNAYGVPTWGSVRTLGLLSLAYHRKELTNKGFSDTTNVKNKLLSLANSLTNYQKNTSPYNIVMGAGGNADFMWGSNSQAANQAMILLNAYFLTRNLDYVNATISQVDYLLGRNATGYSFVTGAGTKRVMNIHHRPSGADGIVEPIPGWLSGGPTGSTGDKCANNPTYLAKSFEDGQACYTKNEIAINWNAPAVYVTGALEFFKLFNTSPVTNNLEEENSYLERASLSVFPVPAQNEATVTVYFPKATKGILKLRNTMGHELMQQNVQLLEGDAQLPLDLSSYKTGVYYVQLEAGGKVLKAKVVVTKQ